MSAYPTCILRPVRGFPSEYCYAVWHGKTRMVWLPDGEKIVTDTQTQTHTDTQTETA